MGKMKEVRNGEGRTQTKGDGDEHPKSSSQGVDGNV